MEQKQEEMKQDGWQNMMTGLGRNRDKMFHNKPAYAPMPYNELHNFVLADPLIQTIIELYVREAKAGEWQLPLDVEQNAETDVQNQKKTAVASNAISKILPSTLLQEILQICIVDGGCLLRLEAVGRYEEELSENIPITGITPIAPSIVVLKNENFEDNANNPNYGKPRYYEIKKNFDAGTYLIHHTRTLAIRKPSFLASMNNLNQWWWGISEIEKLYDICSAVSQVPNVCYNLFSQFGQNEYTLSNMEQLVAAGDWKALEKRVEAIQLQKSVVNGVFLGQGEKVESKSPSVIGLDAIVELLFYLAASFSHIPQSKLFGRGQGGLTSTGTGDEKNLGKFLQSLRSSYLVPVLHDVGKRIAKQSKFNPDVMNEIVWEDDSSTELEMVDVRFKQAQTDKIYFDMSVLTGDEIRTNRFVGGYSIETAVQSEMNDDRFEDFANKDEE
jgi:phage-related protein (TIGR01555 family)